LNLKGKKNNIWVNDGNVFIGNTEVIHPKLKEINGKKVPTIKHGKTILTGATDCIEYIDKTFGVKKDILYPIDPKLANNTLYC
jgi:glutathione S-transferase